MTDIKPIEVLTAEKMFERFKYEAKHNKTRAQMIKEIDRLQADLAAKEEVNQNLWKENEALTVKYNKAVEDMKVIADGSGSCVACKHIHQDPLVDCGLGYIGRDDDCWEYEALKRP